jgi:hypothetical protein
MFRRLVEAERINELDAEHWIARWEREAEAIDRTRDSPGFWDDAWRWIEQQRMLPDAPKTDMNAEGDDGQVYGG